MPYALPPLYMGFLREFGARVWNVHVKDVWWSDRPTPAGVFGGHTDFGSDGRFWDFRSPGRGGVNFEEIIRALNVAKYQGPLSVEWEDSGMERTQGAREACEMLRKLHFCPTNVDSDAALGR